MREIDMREHAMPTVDSRGQTQTYRCTLTSVVTCRGFTVSRVLVYVENCMLLRVSCLAVLEA